ncbi:hypothetical protein [Yoonia sp.]|uniref:hypothetical protein n=1 Tax=Yoonia sp. TaxID=2212373 RepID=UPI0019F5A2BC|nr:hypothetical protein [Yoonia sp.]MBE0414417.1 hypothetical protein [Yoonia sp.]
MSAAFFCLALPAVAQPRAQEPLSAIEWLSRSVEPAASTEPPVANDTRAPQVIVTPLDRPSKDPIGLLPSSVSGLPRTIWAASDEQTLVDLVRTEQRETLPALREFIKLLMLAEADPPKDAGAENALFLARIDSLLDLGAIEQAKALIEQAKPDTAPLFQRWFDVALLTGTEDSACAVMGQNPSIAPTHIARIFCLARNGDWNTAALTLNAHRVLGDVTPAEEALMARFLDPELFESDPPLPRPARISPLIFRMHEAIGEALITNNLPLAFAHADLRGTTAWKARLDATERLARRGAISENQLQQVYTARTPAASGGVWDRVAAFQAFDTAVTAGDADAMSRVLPTAWRAMQDARTEVAFAKLYGPAINDVALTGVARDIALVVGLLSPDYERFARQTTGHAQAAFLIALARGVPQDVPATDPLQRAIQAAFDTAQPPERLQQMINDGKLGEALLNAVVLFQHGQAGDTRALTEALTVLRAAGAEDVARRAALQMLLLERPS